MAEETPKTPTAPLLRSASCTPDSAFFVSVLEDGVRVVDTGNFVGVDGVPEVVRCSVKEALLIEKSSVLVVVGDASSMVDFGPERVRLIGLSSGEVLSDLGFKSEVLRVAASKTRLVVVLETSVHVFALGGSRGLEALVVLHTFPNSRGLVALSGSGDHVVFPSSSDAGEVVVYDTRRLEVESVIPAHGSALAALGMSATGRLLATASVRGTVVRVWTVPEGRLLGVFRRGTTPTRVTGLRFGMDDAILAVCSERPTVHIFSLPTASKTEFSLETLWKEALGEAVAAAGAEGQRATLTIPLASGTGPGSIPLCLSLRPYDDGNVRLSVCLADGRLLAFHLQHLHSKEKTPTATLVGSSSIIPDTREDEPDTTRL